MNRQIVQCECGLFTWWTGRDSRCSSCSRTLPAPDSEHVTTVEEVSLALMDNAWLRSELNKEKKDA